jgi:hypothetical protein
VEAGTKRQAKEDVFIFNRAEDRLAIGIIQSVAHNPTEPQLHAWIAQLLNALNRASKSTEEISSAYQLEMQDAPSIVQEAHKIPAAMARNSFLIDCWLETLCTAEIRVLGLVYQEFYRPAVHPRISEPVRTPLACRRLGRPPGACLTALSPFVPRAILVQVFCVFIEQLQLCNLLASL